jgi:hypothetical protein
MRLSMSELTKDLVLGLLRAYKWALSPMLPPSCRYVPTCSEYAAEAVERFGAWRGSWKAVGRVLRCHPFVKGGYDPVINSHQQAHQHSMSPVGRSACGISH